MCKDWAAVHRDYDALWEAFSLGCDRAYMLSQHDVFSMAVGPTKWLTVRAQGLRQLAFCDGCISNTNPGIQVSGDSQV